MAPEHLLALDLGTTSVRALVVHADGSVRARAQQPLSTRFPSAGLVEQDPREMVESSLDVLRAALGRAGLRGEDISGLGIVTQRATAIAFDARSGEPLAPAIGWQDQRAVRWIPRWRARGLPLTAQSAAARFAFLLAENEAVRAAARAGSLRLCTPESWLAFHLSDGARFVTEPGEASCTGLFDATRGDWNEAICDAIGIDLRWLAIVVPSSAVIGTTHPTLAGVGVAIAALAGDQQAASFAHGVHAAGDARLTLGTAAMLERHTGDRPARAPRGAFPLALWRLGDGTNSFCIEGHVATAGAAVEWMASIGLLPAADALDSVAARATSSEGVFFLPALQGLATPWLAGEVRGAIGGLTRGTGAPQLARALIDGIAHRCTDVCDALAIDDRPLPVDGGLARSQMLLQAIADLGGRSVRRATEPELTAMGGALLAGLATGLLPDRSTCRAIVSYETPIEPRISTSVRAAARARWRSIVDHALEGP